MARRLRIAPFVVTAFAAALLTAPAHAVAKTTVSAAISTTPAKTTKGKVATGADRSVTKSATTSACDQGRALVELGRPADATSAYVKGLATVATANCSKAALSAFNNTDVECAPAKVLEDIERDSDAAAAYRKVLVARPASKCATAGAKRTSEIGVRGWVAQAVKDAGTLASAAAFGLLLLVLLGWVLLIPATRARLTRGLWPFRNFRRVRVQIKALDDSVLSTDKFGASTTGLLRARLRADAGDTRFDQASGGASAADALDGLADAGPQAKSIVAFIKVLRSALPKRDWVITGELQAAGDDGQGLSLAIDNGGTFIDVAAFWAGTMAGPAAADDTAPPAGAEAYRRLVVPAAGWLTYHVAAVTNPDDLPTTNALSSALTHCGVYWYDQGRPGVARGFYQRALGYDNKNSTALANLGFLDSVDEGLEQQAENELNQAKAIVEGG